MNKMKKLAPATFPPSLREVAMYWVQSPDVHGHSRKVSRAFLSAAKGCRKIIPLTTSSRLGVLSLLLVYMLVTNRIPGQQKDTIPPMHVAHIGMRQRLVPWLYSTMLYLSRSMWWTTNERSSLCLQTGLRHLIDS